MPRPFVTLAALLVAASRLTAAPPAPATKNDTAKRLPAVSLLPNDSTLQRVMIPRYDKERRLLAVLRSEHMRIIDSDNASGSDVTIELYRPEGGRRGLIQLKEARFDQKSGLLHGSENATIRSDSLTASGSGVVYELNRSRGFLLGPATTLFYPRPPATSMTLPTRTPHLGTLLASSLAMLPVAALPGGPAALDDTALTRIERDAQPAAVDAADHCRRIDSDLAATAVQSARADTELTGFLRDAALTALLVEPKPANQGDAAAAESTDLGPAATKVLADGGMFFDTAQGILVYLKNIRLTDPRFDLTCSDELKVFFAKKPAPTAKKKPGETENTAQPGGGPDKPPAKPATEPAATPKPAPAGADDAGQPQAASADKAKTDKKAQENTSLLGGDFGDIDHLVATGSVRVVRKDPQGQPVIATADTATYDATSGDVVMRGGFPTLRKGKDYLRALESGLYVRLYANGDVFAQPGKWETGVSDLNQKDLKDKTSHPKPANPR